MKKCVIIYNPVSGKSIKRKFLDEYKSILLDKGYESEIIYKNMLYSHIVIS